MSRILKNKLSIFYLLSFIEGASVMITELIGAKLLAPFFGSSLYVWSTVMAVTLGGLAMGYFIGGRVSSKSINIKIKLQYVLISSGLFMILMPFLSGFVLHIGADLPLLAAVLLSAVLILLPPLFLMGMVSPMIISVLTETASDSGKRSGEIYAISTVGGIISTFLTGFYLIPNFGLTMPIITSGFVLMLPPLILLLRHKIYANSIILILLACGALFLSRNKYELKNVLYESEGLLGKLEVVDYEYSIDSTQAKKKSRLLLINNIIQTWITRDSNESELEYTDVVFRNLDKTGKRKKALLLGLGGGAVANVLHKNNYDVTAIELDRRMYQVAQKYFSLNEDVRVIIDDARHGVNQLSGKFDLVMMDLFNGEVAPSHVMSIESLEKIKSMMNDSAVIIINTYGYLKAPAGNGNLALLNTLRKSGMNYKICNVGIADQEDYRNLLIYASVSKLPGLESEISEPLAMNESVVITDDKPVLEYLNAKAAKRWRYAYLHNFILARH